MTSEEGICDKCGNFGIVDMHHILPKATFGKNNEAVKLCPNCHRAYHKALGTENLKNNDPEFHFYFFYRWKYGLLALVLFLSSVVGFFWWKME